MQSHSAQNRLDDIVKGLNKKKNKYIFLKDSSIIAIIFFISVATASILSLFSTNPYYYAFLKSLILLVLILALIKTVVLPIRRKSGKTAILEELDKVSKGLGEDTLSALELKQSVANSSIFGTSKELALAHIDRTTTRLTSLDLSSFYPIQNLRKYFTITVAGFILASLTLIFLPGNFQKYLFSFNLTPMKTGAHLELADIEITLQYPEYTKLPPQIIKGTKGNISAIKGTAVKFQAESVSSFEKGSLIIENGISVPVTKSDGKIRANFTVLGSGSFIIKESSRDLVSETFRIMAEEDKTPIVKISSPLGETVELGSEDKMDIFYEAEDDFSISKLTLSWENQREQSELPIKTKDQDTNTIEGRLTWGPRGINPANGDTIKLKVLAYDNDTISGPKVGVSNSITIKLKDARSKHKETLNFAEQLMEELIDILGDEIDISSKREKDMSPQSPKPTRPIVDLDEMLREQKKLTKKIQHAKGTLNITISSMKEDEYSDFTNFVALSNMEARIGALLGERKHLIESFVKLDTGRLDRLMKREIVEFEDDILFLDSLIKGGKLRDSLLSSNDLLSEYRELSELLKQLEEGGNEGLEQQIQEKLEQIQNLMSQLAKKMDGLSGDIQEGFLNQDAFEAANMQDQLDQIAKLAQEGKVQEALEMLASMAQSLQNMMASLENGMQSFGSSMMGQGMSKLNKLLSRIGEIEKQESILRESTGELKKSLLENANLDNYNPREFIDREIKKVQELTENLKEVRAKAAKGSPSERNTQSDYLIEKMIEKTQQLNNWLKAMDLGEAQKNAKSIEESTQGFRDMSQHNFANLGKAAQEINRADRLAKEIRDDLERFGAQMQKGNQFGKMATRQDEIESETDDLTKELSEPESGLFVSPGIGENLELAEDFMGSASRDLRARQVSKAMSNQDEALKALREAKEQAQQMLQQMQMSAKGNGMPTPMMLGQQRQSGGTQGTDNRYVEIPQVDEANIGKEYKQRILEAMKGGSPEGYIELNKKYYDRIIK